jgi:RNA polymerase sigma-70 factor (ECF subfamily)
MNDEDRFEALFRATYPQVLAYGRRRLTATVAQDVAAETYVVAWRRRQQLPEGDAVLPWLLAIARRVTANHTRSDRRWRRLRHRLSAEPPLPFVASNGDMPRVRAALTRLSSDDQEILRLAYWDDLSHDEIAAVLSISANSVGVRLHRARQRLRTHLADGQLTQTMEAARGE